jgi:hypothetical protein
VVFVDKASMEASLKAARKAARKSSSSAITWAEGLDKSKIPALGLQRYITHQRACYPPRADLLRRVNEYMNVFTEVAEARKREAARRAAEPDEDGFVTVTSGPRLTSAAGEEEAKRLIEKQKKKQEGFGDFYRFQSREKRKERQIELLKKFDEDKKKLEEMKLRKGKIRVRVPSFGYLTFANWVLAGVIIWSGLLRVNLAWRLQVIKVLAHFHHVMMLVRWTQGNVSMRSIPFHCLDLMMNPLGPE